MKIDDMKIVLQLPAYFNLQQAFSLATSDVKTARTMFYVAISNVEFLKFKINNPP